ncbi:MAG: YaaL family protein [Lachnospiraceae bacterium]|nr:YaaL family protein [Lachnospiraceae bacterium]
MFLLTKGSEKNDPHYTLLLDNIKKTERELEIAYANFEHAVDPDLIDSSIYELNAIQLRYKFLLSCAKQFENVDL